MKYTVRSNEFSATCNGVEEHMISTHIAANDDKAGAAQFLRDWLDDDDDVYADVPDSEGLGVWEFVDEDEELDEEGNYLANLYTYEYKQCIELYACTNEETVLNRLGEQFKGDSVEEERFIEAFHSALDEVANEYEHEGVSVEFRASFQDWNGGKSIKTNSAYFPFGHHVADQHEVIENYLEKLNALFAEALRQGLEK